MSFRQIAGIAGVVFVVLLAITIALTAGEPSPADPLSDVVDYYQDDAGLIEVALGLGTAAILLLPVWLVGIVGRLGGQGEPWAVVGLVGGAIIVAAATVQGAFDAALVLRHEQLGDDSFTLLLWDLRNITFAGITIAGAVLLGGLSIATLLRGGLPAWLGWLGAVGALAGAVGAIPIVALADGSDIGLFAFAWFIIFLLWVLISSVLLIRSEAPAPA